jgi:co-chaperonin GroES (HSP10)
LQKLSAESEAAVSSMRSEFSGPTNSVALPEDMKLEETVVVSAQEEEEEEKKKKKIFFVSSSLQSENGNNVVAVINPKPAAYNLDEIASNLHETATKALEQTETVRNGAAAQASIVEDVAHLVLDHNNNNNDDASSSSRDYLVGVIQKVADYAEQAGQSKAAALNEGDDIVVTSTSPNHVDQSSTVSSISISKFFCSR